MEGRSENCKRLTSKMFSNVYKTEGGKPETNIMPFGSPVSFKAGHLVKDESFYMSPDTKDSGYSDDIKVEVLLPASLPSEETIVTFPSEGIQQSTCSPSQFPPKKRFRFNTTEESPCSATANGLKKLRLFDLKDDVAEPHCEDSLEPLAEEESFVPEASSNKDSLYAISDDRQEQVKEAVEKSVTKELIGDFTKCYALPVINGSHPDLKCISPETLQGVIDGKFDNIVNSFKIIDSRYPYEYAGGHIKGAENIYKMENCFELLNLPAKSKDERHILIFHCEFSKERGPTMVRNLRKEDRNRNGSNYPALVYPEIYVLEGGYKKFFEAFPEYCHPTEYTKMLDPNHEEEMQFFRQQCKSSESVTGTNKKGRYGKVFRTPYTVRKALSTNF